jgi:hypothetical protein
VNRPDAALVRQILPTIDWASRSYAAPTDPAADDPLQFLVDMAADYVEETTGRKLDATMPEQYVRMAQMAVALAAVAFMFDFSDEQLDALAEGSVLASFSADGYSENYRDTGTQEQAQRKGLMIHPWAPLNRLLWALLTPEKRVWWFGFLQGGGIPSYGFAEIDWSGGNRYGGVPGAPGDGGLAGDEVASRSGSGVGRYATGSNPGALGWDRPVG